MANYIVNGNDLTLIANSIRSKGNTSGELVWPTGFKNAIDNISVDVKDICIKTTDFDDVVKVDDAAALGARDVVAKIEPVQDLHGYDSPWPGGGRKNKANPAEAQNNKWIDETTGQITDTNGYWVTGFIPVKYGDMVRCTTKGTIRNAWYNSDKSQATYAIYGGGNEGLFAPFDGFIVMAVASGTIAYGGDFMVTINDEDLTYSPYSNICPITGWTGAEVYRTGKNLFNTTMEQGTINSDGDNNPSKSIIRSIDYIPVKPNTNYSMSRDIATGYVNVRMYDINKEYLGGGNTDYFILINGYSKAQPMTAGRTSCAFMFSNEVAYFRFVDSSNDLSAKYQLELGSTATAYEPYQGDVYDITFPSEAGTIYGGTVDLTRGKLVVDRAMVDLGTLNWLYDTNGRLYTIGLNGIATGAASSEVANIICSIYDAASNTDTYTHARDNIISMGISGYTYIYSSTWNSADGFAAYISGQTLCYELTTPVTYDLTPQEIEMYKGTNILSSTTGKTQLKYFTEAFEPLAAEIGFVNGGDY